MHYLFVWICFLSSLTWAQKNETPSASQLSWPEALQNSLLKIYSQHTTDSLYRPYYISVRMHDTAQSTLLYMRGRLVDSISTQHKVFSSQSRIGNPSSDFSLEILEAGTLQNFGVEEIPNLLTPSQAAPLLEQAIEWGLRDTKEQYKKIQIEQLHRIKDSKKGFDLSPYPQSKNNFNSQQITCSHKREALKTISPLLQQASAIIDSTWVYESIVRANSSVIHKYFSDTENRNIQSCDSLTIVVLSASTQVQNGQVLQQSRNISIDLNQIQNQYSELSQTILGSAQDLISTLSALKNATIAQPASAPTLLEGPAAAVLIHEILGHRLEAHRFKSDLDGQTFMHLLNRPILPKYISIWDMPLLQTWNGTRLNGYYLYDDQGIPAQNVELVKNGTLIDFLKNRHSIQNEWTSNGHGRGELSLLPVSRMGNLILKSAKTFTLKELKKQLLSLLKKSHKEYGFIVRDLSGGFTHTDRVNPQSFKLKAEVVLKVYAHGKEEIIRGLDVAGSPQNVFNQIIAVGNEASLFNGFCGAESGWVPVSAISPALLLKNLDFELQELNHDSPPFVPKPN
jgi:TldD protein